MRGRNFTNCLVVVDEAQNLTDNQTELLLTRICDGSKMIFCGDAAQIDLKDRKTSGFDVICKHMKEVPGFGVITLEKNHRHPIVDDILEVYKSFRS
jgi:phosphate starvation-inducible protein PhoH